MTQPQNVHIPLNVLVAAILVLSFAADQPLIGEEGDSGSNTPPAEADSTAVLPLESGPIHEAFAEPVALNPQPGVNVQQRPPERVPELPPQMKPRGDNVIWIPGYWAWSETIGDFIWVSGIWRDAPPGQRWVPGYWTETDEGHQWTRGFWTGDESEELVYLPEPPESLETQPTVPRPGPDHFWIPGTWRWNDGQYYWRGGFWHPAQQNWIWVPAQYYYTPLGYVYQRGYWDFPLQRRGLLFAPVFFQSPAYQANGYYFTPNSWIDVAVLTTGLFVSPRYGHYFYGNYYGPGYASAGFYPWYEYHQLRYGYDPLFAYDSWRYGQRDSAWFNNLRDDYRRRESPRRTDSPIIDRAAAEADRDDRRTDGNRVQFVHNVEELPAVRPEEVTRIDETERQEAAERSRQRFSEFRQQRNEVENQAPLDGRGESDSVTARPEAVRPPDSDAESPAERPGVEGTPREVQQPTDTPPQDSRPAGPVQGRFQLPERVQRGAPDAERVRGSGNRPDTSQRHSPQVPQRPPQTQERGSRSEGQSGGRVREVPQDRGDRGSRSNRDSRGNQQGSRKESRS